MYHIGEKLLAVNSKVKIQVQALIFIKMILNVIFLKNTS